MSCDECLSLLDRYVENEVHDQAATSVTAHIASCRECADAHETLRREQELYASYLVDVEPSPDLWTNLQSELNTKVISVPQTQSRLQRWLAMAFGGPHVTPQFVTAFVLMVIGLAIGLMLWRTTSDAPRHQAHNPGPGVQPPSNVNREGTPSDSNNTDRTVSATDNDEKTPPASPKRREIRDTQVGRASRRVIERTPAAPTAAQVARSAEQQYLAAIEILSRDFERRRANMSPELLPPLETALAEVDRNIAATRKAAREQPGDPVAVQYLAIAYEKKVELLREVTSRSD